LYNLRNFRSSVGLIFIALLNGGLYAAVFSKLGN